MLNIIDITIFHTGVIFYKDHSFATCLRHKFVNIVLLVSMPNADEVVTSHVNYLLAELPISILQDLSCTALIIP